MSNQNDVFDIESLAERFDLEAKKAQGRHCRGELPMDFFPTYSAMANTEGGTILLGVDEYETGKFKVIGIQEIDRVRKALWDGVNNKQRISVNLLSESDVQVKNMPEGSILAITIPRASRRQRPVFVGSPWR